MTGPTRTTRRGTRRVALAALAAVAVLLPGAVDAGAPTRPSPASTGEHYPKAVEMTVDYTAKKITIVGRLDFYQPSGMQPDDTTIGRIVGAIESAWNGHRFKCFDVVVQVDARTVNRKSQVRDDAIDVRLDASRIGAHSKVIGQDPTGDHLGDDPAHRPLPGRETGQETVAPTTWGKYTQPYVWAHEFGHVLGLHDNYEHLEEGKSSLKTGAARDMMFHQRLPISAEMITRVVRRNNTGQLDESKVRCPLTMDAGPAGINLIFMRLEGLGVHAYTCDYDPPSGDPKRKPAPISWVGTATVSGAIDAFFFGSGEGTFNGPVAFTSEADQDFPFSAAPGHLDFTGRYTWGTNGVPVSARPLTLNGVSSAEVGLGLFPVFTEGAAECP